MYRGCAFSQQFLTKHVRTQQKLEKLVSNWTDSSVSVDEKVEAAGRGPFLFPTYLGRSKGLCSQGTFSKCDSLFIFAAFCLFVSLFVSFFFSFVKLN